MFRKIFIIAAISVFIFGGLFYFSARRDSEEMVGKEVKAGQPIVNWQKIMITEKEQNISINMTVPRVIIYSSDGLGNKVNKAITGYIELLRDDFIFSVGTAAYDNGETSTLNVDTEALLITPRLISLSFTVAEHLAGIEKDDDPQQTFLIFDLTNSAMLKEGNELFRDDIAWSRAVKMMKNYLLADYQGDPSCDLLFAPKYNGFAASCLGVDWSRGGKRLSITGNISISMIQEFLAPSILSDVIQ